MGFALLVVPFNDNPDKCNMAEYTSNLQRADMIRLLRQMANTLETQGTIPSTIGCA